MPCCLTRRQAKCFEFVFQRLGDPAFPGAALLHSAGWKPNACCRLFDAFVGVLEGVFSNSKAPLLTVQFLVQLSTVERQSLRPRRHIAE